MSVLLIDIGNSRIKYATVNSVDEPIKVQTTEQIEDLIAAIQKCDKLLLANVASSNHVAFLGSACSQFNSELRVIETQPKSLGVTCAYSEYQNMGVDRWLAILAVRAKTTAPVIVVSVGTAVTCDFVIDNQHLGGWISPGFDLMREAVTSKTSKVFGNKAYPQKLNHGKGTEDCVNHGCLAAVQGILSRAEEHMSQFASEFQIYISGGGVSLLKEFKKTHWHFCDNLVLEGLKRFI